MADPEQNADRLEARFAREGLDRCLRGARFFCAFAVAMLIASAAYSPFSEPDVFRELLRIRLSAVTGIAFVFALLATPFGRRRPRELTVALLIILAATLHELALPTGGQHSPQYDRLTIVLLAPTVLMSWGLGWSLLGSAAVIGVFTGGSMLAYGAGTDAFAANFGRLCAVAILTATTNAFRERYRWRELWHSHSLAEAHRRADREILRLNEDLERRVAERTAELVASETRFRAMFEHAPIGIITVSVEGRLEQANQAFAAMLGRDAGDLVGESIADYVAPEDRARTLQAFRDLAAGEQDEFQMDKRYTRRDGTAVVAHEAVAALRDGTGRFTHALGMVEDVTDRVHAEERARAHQEQLAHVHRVSTMGEMAAQLAHELNQPLGAIVNYANGACTRLRDAGADPAIVDAVARIAGEGMRAAEIIRRVREFVRRSVGLREAVDLNHLVREAASLIENDARRQAIPLRLRLHPSLPALGLDRVQMEQVILNLLRNAIDAMSDSPPESRELLVETALANGSVEVRVRDTGIGVAAEHAERIFEAFFTSKPGGLGMGLSISRAIVEAHGGRLVATPNPERGMTFAFSLAAPARPTDSGTPARAADPPAMATGEVELE